MPFLKILVPIDTARSCHPAGNRPLKRRQPILIGRPQAVRRPPASEAADRAQLDRDIAAIEKASAALRRADPAMETWTDAPATAMQKPRPVWL